MKKLFVITCALFFVALMHAQTFSFQLYFETARGERDSLEIGYAPGATHRVDDAFDEINYGSPISQGEFQAFITGRDWTLIPSEHLFYLRTQMVNINSSFSIAHGAIPVIFPKEALPVTVSWNKELFDDVERDYSVITDHPARWNEDFYCTFYHYLKDINSLVINPICDDLDPLDDSHRMFEYGKNDFRIFYIAFGNKQNIFAGMDELKLSSQVNVYPNPVSDFCVIEKHSDVEIQQVQVFSISGEKIMDIKGKESVVDCRNLPKGINILVIEMTNGEKIYSKLIKK